MPETRIRKVHVIAGIIARKLPALSVKLAVPIRRILDPLALLAVALSRRYRAWTLNFKARDSKGHFYAIQREVIPTAAFSLSSFNYTISGYYRCRSNNRITAGREKGAGGGSWN